MKWLSKFLNRDEIKEITEKELKENIGVIESLREYDQGNKEISTADIERRLPNIRVSR